MVKIGTVAETAIWLNGEETPEHLKRWREKDLPDLMQIYEYENGVILGDIEFDEFLPIDERVPEVPDHIRGIDVRLLVATATVIRYADPKIMPKPFLEDLRYEDRALLRRATRKAHKANSPDVLPLSDERCDEIIEYLGQETAERVLDDAIKNQ